MSKLRWTECGEKLITVNGTVQYRIRRTPQNTFSASASLQMLGSYRTQLDALAVCQMYEDKINE